MLDFLAGWVSQSPLTYLVIAGLALADIFAIVPADTVVVTAAVLALQGPLLLAGVAGAAFVGAALGDNLLYVLGRRIGPPLVGRMFRGESAKERLDWAYRQMHRHRNLAIIAGRFVPLGRTATMFAAGLANVPWRLFIVPDLVAAGLWVAYYVVVSVLFGDRLPTWLTILLALAVAVLLAGAIEVVRRYSERGRDRADEEETAPRG